MGLSLLDDALKGLESLGVSAPAHFVELLLSNGVDVLTEVPRIAGIIGALGANPMSMMTEIADGMQASGPVEFVQSLLHKAFDASTARIQTIHSDKQSLISTHQTLLSNLDTRINELNHSSPGGFSGPAATAMLGSYQDLKTRVNKHIDLLQQSLSIDQDFFNQIEIAIDVGFAVGLVTLVIVAAAVLAELAVGVVLAGLTAETGVGPVIVGGVDTAAITGTIATGLEVLGTEAAAVLAAIIACYVIWSLRHSLLTQVSSFTLPNTYQIRKTQVLNNPVPTPEQEQAINDLATELGLTDPKQIDWLRYLVSLLGTTKLTLDQIKNIIRCLNSRGWLQNTNPASWNDDYQKAWNIVVDQLQPDDIQAAWMDMRGIPVIDKYGNVWPSHLEKVSDALDGLKKLLNSRKQPPLSKAFKDALRKLINWVEEKVFGPDDPKTWTDKGRSPFWEDIIKNSGCLKSVT